MSNLAPRPDYPPNAANGGIDAGRYECDLILGKVERKVYLTYLQAAKEMRQKADDYLEEFLIEDKRRAQLVADGKMKPEDYKNWRISHIATGRRWYEMAYVLAQDMTNTNEIASGIINDYMPDVFAAGYNYGLYQCEITGGFRTSFTMYDRDTVMRLLRDDPDLLPSSWIDAQKDTAWNQKQFNSAMLQAILQGESIDEIAERIVKNVSGMNERTAIRHARTAYTSAENGGRYESYRRMKSEGVNLTVEWCATLDGRTRPTHRLADGERHDVDEPFVVDGYNIMYAGDPQAPQKEIWNCRCTMLAWVKGFENDRGWKAQTRPDNMSYAEWKFAKQEEYEQEQERARQRSQINPDNPSYGYANRNPFDQYASAVDMGTLYEAQNGAGYYQEQQIPPRNDLTLRNDDGIMQAENQDLIRNAFIFSESTTSEDVANAIIENHELLAEYTPESMKDMLEQLGFTILPLGKRSSLKGIPFENGGGYRINYLGNGYFQYHPKIKSHHNHVAYWKISSAGTGENRYDMEGKPLPV